MRTRAISTRAVHGPKMRALTDRQRKFVLELLNQPRRNLTDAARRAGYRAKRPQTLHVIASHLAANPRVLDAMEEFVIWNGPYAKQSALHTLERAIAAPGSKSEVAVKAAIRILDRVEWAPTRKVEEPVKPDILSDDQMIARIEVIARTLGVPLSQLLGARTAERLNNRQRG